MAIRVLVVRAVAGVALALRISTLGSDDLQYNHHITTTRFGQLRYTYHLEQKSIYNSE